MNQSFTISNAPWDFDYAIYFRHVGTDSGGRFVAYAQPVTMLAVSSEAETFDNPKPMLRVTKDALQQLMDELWRVGIRPSEGTGSAGALAATERHLQDMRRLALDHLEERKEIKGEHLPNTLEHR